MAGNSLLTSSVIVKRGLAQLVEQLKVLGMVNRQYDTEFGYKGGARQGDTISVRVPQRGIVRKGRIMDLQANIDQTIPVKIDQYYGMDTGATSAEMAMQIDDFDKSYITPRIADLLSNVEADFINKVTPLVPTTVGAYGAFNSALIALQAKAALDAQLAPSQRNMLVNTYSQVDIVDGLKSLFNSQDKIGTQYRKGRMAEDTLGADWYSSNLTSYITRGTGAGYLVNGAGQSGSSLVVGTGTGTIVPGDTFTIAGVYSVHPQTKQALPGLKNFTVTTAYTPGGAGTLAITPAIVTSGSEQNVSAAPANGAAITIKGVAGTSYAQNVEFAKDAFFFVTADLPNPPNSYGVDSASATYEGITLRFMQGFDMTNDMYLSRFDLVWGGGILRPELAVRIPATVTAP